MTKGKSVLAVTMLLVLSGAGVAFGRQNGGGVIKVSVEAPPPSVDLTADGASDWVHWGLIKEGGIVHRKASGNSQIGDIKKLGARELHTYENNPTPYLWSDGRPTAKVEKTRSGVFTYGKDGGYEFAVPAGKAARTLKVYAGVWGASRGKFEATLSDASAPAFVHTEVEPGTTLGITDKEKITNVVYVINYRAASDGQKLTVRFTNMQASGNVELQAATLSGNK